MANHARSPPWLQQVCPRAAPANFWRIGDGNFRGGSELVPNVSGPAQAQFKMAWTQYGYITLHPPQLVMSGHFCLGPCQWPNKKICILTLLWKSCETSTRLGNGIGITWYHIMPPKKLQERVRRALINPQTQASSKHQSLSKKVLEHAWTQTTLKPACPSISHWGYPTPVIIS